MEQFHCQLLIGGIIRLTVWYASASLPVVAPRKLEISCVNTEKTEIYTYF